MNVTQDSFPFFMQQSPPNKTAFKVQRQSRKREVSQLDLGEACKNLNEASVKTKASREADTICLREGKQAILK